jgi:hypothetical protein
MSVKQQFGFLIRPEERQALKNLAAQLDRSEAATLRYLIRDAARKLAGQQQPAQAQPPAQGAPQTPR